MPEEAIIGAFFILPDFEKLLKSKDISVSAVAKNLLIPTEILDDVLVGKRVTHITALEIIRALNKVLLRTGRPTVDPREVILTDKKLGKRGAAAMRVIQPSPYETWDVSSQDTWPELLPEDDPAQWT